MKIIKPSVEFFGAVPTDYTNALRFIEMAGRLCYKSEDKITAESAEPFVKRLIKSGHLAMVEHSNFVVRADQYLNAKELQGTVGSYLKVLEERESLFVGGNLTAWYAQSASHQWQAFEWLVPFEETLGELFELPKNYLHSNWQVCPHNEIPKELHRYSAKFICDRGVSHELVRHRPCSFAQESTRYVNYGGKDMEFVEPAGWDGWGAESKDLFDTVCRGCEADYNMMINDSLKPQQARAILSNALKTEIVVTADAAEWAHIKKLRTHPSAHPDMARLMNMMPWEDFL
jgi:thymidylate synthase (FAD)